MISAKEAKTTSLLNGRAKKYLDNLEKVVLNACNQGEFSAKISIDLMTNSFDDQKTIAVLNEKLESLGYSVEIKPAEPLPHGCRSDQWDFNNGYIKVLW